MYFLSREFMRTKFSHWKCLHIDFAGPYEGSMWLIVIDAATKWPEVIKMNNNTTAERTIEILHSLFSRLGLPNQIVSDNRPQFISDQYHQFCINNGIRRILISHYHPRSNGEAERFVQTFKSAIRRWVYRKLYVSFRSSIAPLLILVLGRHCQN